MGSCGSCVSVKGRELYSTGDSPDQIRRNNHITNHHQPKRESGSVGGAEIQDLKMSRLAQAAVISPSAKHTATVSVRQHPKCNIKILMEMAIN